jgi:hypothetical protein
VRDDVVEHLAAVDVFKDHVVVMRIDEHGFHAADVRVMEEEDDGGFADGASLLGQVLGVRFGEEGFGREWWRCLLTAGLAGRILRRRPSP